MKNTLLTILAVTAPFILLSCDKSDSEIPSYTPPHYTPESYTGVERELQKADFEKFWKVVDGLKKET